MDLTVPFNFTPRKYQLPFFKAMDSGIRYAILMWPRRHGKDKSAFCYIIKRMLQEVGNYAYIFPTGALAREAAWTNIDKDGFSLLNHIPKELIRKKREDQMYLELVNGSTLKFFGSDKKDSVGPNYRGIVLSEFALQNPYTYYYLRPILRDNKGFLIITSTVRGKNHYFDLWNIAKTNEEWFTQKLTWEDCGELTEKDIEDERKGGMSDEMIRSEYYNDFTGLEGSYYVKYLDKMRLNNQLTNVPYDPNARVFTAWDIGVNDPTTIIWFQVIGQEIHVIDCYKNNNLGLDHYAKIILDKPYIYEAHFAPHDINVREWGNNAITRLEIAEKLGIKFTVLEETLKISKQDVIEVVRGMFQRVWIDDIKCKELISSLENYRKEFNKKNDVYTSKPVHDEYSHFSDAFSYMALGIKTYDSNEGLSTEEIYNLNERSRRFV